MAGFGALMGSINLANGGISLAKNVPGVFRWAKARVTPSTKGWHMGHVGDRMGKVGQVGNKAIGGVVSKVTGGGGGDSTAPSGGALRSLSALSGGSGWIIVMFGLVLVFILLKD